MENFTVSFSDGRVLCYLIHHYHPGSLPEHAISRSTTQTVECSPWGRTELDCCSDSDSESSVNLQSVQKGVVFVHFHVYFKKSSNVTSSTCWFQGPWLKFPVSFLQYRPGISLIWIQRAPGKGEEQLQTGQQCSGVPRGSSSHDQSRGHVQHHPKREGSVPLKYFLNGCIGLWRDRCYWASLLIHPHCRFVGCFIFQVVTSYLSFLCSRLLDLRNETRAARVIQDAWRKYRLIKDLELYQVCSRAAPNA